MVGLQILDLCILVRVQVPQQIQKQLLINELIFLLLSAILHSNEKWSFP